MAKMYPSTFVTLQAEPVWEIAQLFPSQGNWSEEEYLALNTNHFVEFSHGHLEFLPMPTQSHQYIVLFLYQLLWAFLAQTNAGEILVSPLRIRLWPGKYREPDLVFMRHEHASRRHEAFWEGADLVMEVISPDDPHRDWVTKRREYAQAAIPEYWIIDPQNREITVLHLADGRYEEHGLFLAGSVATSVLLAGFGVEVTAVFAAPR